MPNCSPRPKRCGTRVICAGGIQLRQSRHSPATACRSNRSSEPWVSSDRRCVAREPTCSTRDNALSTRTVCSFRTSAAAAAAMALNSGVVCRPRVRGIPACRWRVENAPTSVGSGQQTTAAKESLSQNHRSSHDRQTKLHDQGRRRNHHRHRFWCAVPR